MMTFRFYSLSKLYVMLPNYIILNSKSFSNNKGIIFTNILSQYQSFSLVHIRQHAR